MQKIIMITSGKWGVGKTTYAINLGATLNYFGKDLKNLSDYIIVDSSAGLGEEVRHVMEMADELIVITNPEMPAITDALKAIKLAEEMKKPVMGIIMTRVKNDKIELQPDTVKEMLEVPILGMIPEDINVKKALNEKDAVVHIYPKSQAARAYKEIAANLIDTKYDSKKDREKVFKRVLKRLGLMS